MRTKGSIVSILTELIRHVVEDCSLVVFDLEDEGRDHAFAIVPARIGEPWGGGHMTLASWDVSLKEWAFLSALTNHDSLLVDVVVVVVRWVAGLEDALLSGVIPP